MYTGLPNIINYPFSEAIMRMPLASVHTQHIIMRTHSHSDIGAATNPSPLSSLLYFSSGLLPNKNCYANIGVYKHSAHI